MPARLPRRVLPVLLLLPLLAACSDDKSSSGGPTVTSTDSACDVSSTELRAGTHTFAVTNQGKDVTEVYVYGDGDKVIGEVENIGPGLTRDLKVKLAAGSYSVACKPGQKGDGIRTPITVRG
jgi:iron uptake system component EfeO